MYENGLGVPQDDAEAARWYAAAAEKGLPIAQNNLGIRYYNGAGVPENLILAYMWFDIAAVNGNSDALRNRNIVTQQLTRAEIAEAAAMADEWIETHAAP
jgi:TPR repeat protein